MSTAPNQRTSRLAVSRGRDVARLLSDFGHDLPAIPAPGDRVREPRLFPKGVPWRGRTRPDSGWAAANAPVAGYRMTSDQAPVFWPFIAAPALPPTGAIMGLDQTSGGAFYADPLGWVLRGDIGVTNPNVFCMGKPGTGKSGTTKAFCNRMLGFGYRVLILGDLKDEYEELCRAYGVEPFTIGVGLPTRVNPLAFGPLGHGWEHLDPAEAQRRAAIVFTRWQTLVGGLVGSQKVGKEHVPYGPDEAKVVRAGLEHLTGYSTGQTVLTETTLPELWHLLDNPTPDLVSLLRFSSIQHFFDETRLLRNALDQLVNGVLAGLFDDHTTIDVDWTAPIQSFSLSRLNELGDEACAIALMCLNSWGRGMREITTSGDLRIVVRDESWRQLRLGVEAVKSFDADLRLSRGAGGQGGDIQFAVAHKPSDLLAVGDVGSQAATIAKDLLALADIKILHGQDKQVGDELDTMLGLGPKARKLILGWCRQEKGRALWRVGESMYKVQTVLSPDEMRMFYTNAAIEAAA